MVKAKKNTETKNEVAVVEKTTTAVVLTNEDAAMLALLTGDVATTGEGNFFPRMSVVQEIPEDENGDPIEYNGKVVKKGQFAVSNGTDTVYAETVSLRILAARQQIMKLDAQYKPIAQTIFFENWGQELIDDTGGLKCGFPVGKKEKDALGAEKIATIKKTTNPYLHVWGLATVEGFDEPQLVHWRLRGNGYFEMNKFLDGFGDKQPYQMFNVTVRTRKEIPEGGKPFFVPVFEVDRTKVAPFGVEVREAAAQILEFINTHNAGVRNKHIEKRDKAERDAKSDGVAAKVVNAKVAYDQSPIDEDLNDDLDGVFND